jgi:hypothetical protein
MKPRAKRRRLPRGWAKGLEFPPLEPKGRPPLRRRKDDVPISVTDDWPEQVPIGDTELRVLEGYLRHELDELFGGPLL